MPATARRLPKLSQPLVEALREDTPDMVARDSVATCGKTSRRARSGADHPLHMVSAWASRRRLLSGPEATDASSTEISAIPIFLQRLQLSGALVTIDAIGTRTRIARNQFEGGPFRSAVPAIFWR